MKKCGVVLNNISEAFCVSRQDAPPPTCRVDPWRSSRATAGSSGCGDNIAGTSL